MGKRSAWFFGIALCLLALLSGCGGGGGQTEKPAEEEITLWILTEKTESSGMNDQAKAAIRRFEAAHPGIMVDLEILPESGQERELRLEQLRTRIMAGDGPDGYLLPASLWQWPAVTPLQIIWDGDQAAFVSAQPQENPEPVFLNVNMAMHSGLFADLSAYYDADAELDAQALQQTVMDAGVIDGARYTLPLRYEIPVIYADAGLLAAEGLDIEQMSGDMYAYWDTLLSTGKLPWMKGALYRWGVRHMQLLPELYDYEAEEVTLQKETLRSFLEHYQEMRAAIGNHPLWDQTDFLVYWLTGTFLDEEVPIEPGSLDRAYTAAAIGMSRGKPVTMLPLRSVDGEIVARVTYFAAAGSGTEHLELTYAFLREFLTEETQWQRIQEGNATGSSLLLAADGWPVRNTGAAEPLWSYIKQAKGYEEKLSRTMGRGIPRQKRLLETELEDRDVPVLSVSVDRAYFDNDMLQALLDTSFQKLNDPERNRMPADVDLDQVAEDILRDLARYLAEG